MKLSNKIFQYCIQTKKPLFTPKNFKFKSRRKTIPAPYYDNILNHNTNEYI
jgi:hypothetical protein